jgi:hypothetical protein
MNTYNNYYQLYPIPDLESDIKDNQPIIIYFDNTYLNNIFNNFLKTRKLKLNKEEIENQVQLLKKYSDNLDYQLLLINYSNFNGWRLCYDTNHNSKNINNNYRKIVIGSTDDWYQDEETKDMSEEEYNEIKEMMEKW